jgi:hypothetical protein
MTQFTDQDVVLAGDFNVKRGDEPAMDEYWEGGFGDLNVNDIPTTYEGSVPFDRVLVVDQPEYAISEMWVLEPDDKDVDRLRDPNDAKDKSLRPNMLHKKYLSDHYMVGTSVKVQDDDD